MQVSVCDNWGHILEMGTHFRRRTAGRVHVPDIQDWYKQRRCEEYSRNMTDDAENLFLKEEEK
jgi:hypothetical protein